MMPRLSPYDSGVSSGGIAVGGGVDVGPKVAVGPVVDVGPKVAVGPVVDVGPKVAVGCGVPVAPDDGGGILTTGTLPH